MKRKSEEISYFLIDTISRWSGVDCISMDKRSVLNEFNHFPRSVRSGLEKTLFLSFQGELLVKLLKYRGDALCTLPK